MDGFFAAQGTICVFFRVKITKYIIANFLSNLTQDRQESNGAQEIIL